MPSDVGRQLGVSLATRRAAIWVVLASALMWGFWWYPVGLIEAAGLEGPWIGVAMCAAALPMAGIWAAIRPGTLSPRAMIGAALIGVAVMLYAVAVAYTDFIRAVLLFYLAPAWSTLREHLFFGRRWSVKSLVAIGCSLTGVVLISRGELALDGVGAAGDWMALGSGLAWSVGCALMFSARAAETGRVLLAMALGGVAGALLLAWADGSVVEGWPDPRALIAGHGAAVAIVCAYVGAMMASTMWGAFRLPPAVMTYLLSVEIFTGVLSAALILGEPFGWFEIGGAVFIIAAVLVEVLWLSRTR